MSLKINRLFSIFSRFRTVLANEGLLVLAFRVLGETVYRRLLVFQTSLPLAGESAPARWLHADEAERYARFYPSFHEQEFHRRYALGERCLVVEKDERWCHAVWFASGGVHLDYLGLDLAFKPGEVYSYQSYTPPTQRGKNYASRGAVAASHLLKAEGFDSIIACLQPDRAIAYPPLIKLNAKPVAYLGWFGLGSWRRTFRRPTNRYPWYASRLFRYDWNKVQSHASGSSYLDCFLGRMKRRAHLSLIRRWGGFPATGRLLKTDLFEEAGGTDSLLNLACQLSGSVVGMDVSTAITSTARVCHRQDGMRLLSGDVRQLPFARNSFDLVYSPSTLDHFPNPSDLQASLLQFHQSLRPGGRLIITLDNRQNVTDWLLRLIARLGLSPYYLGRSYTAAELRSELENAGFEVLSQEWLLHAPRLLPVLAMTMARRLRIKPLQRLMRRLLLRLDTIGRRRMPARTGAFVAALARPQK